MSVTYTNDIVVHVTLSDSRLEFIVEGQGIHGVGKWEDRDFDDWNRLSLDPENRAGLFTDIRLKLDDVFDKLESVVLRRLPEAPESERSDKDCLRVRFVTDDPRLSSLPFPMINSKTEQRYLPLQRVAGVSAVRSSEVGNARYLPAFRSLKPSVLLLAEPGTADGRNHESALARIAKSASKNSRFLKRVSDPRDARAPQDEAAEVVIVWCHGHEKHGLALAGHPKMSGTELAQYLLPLRPAVVVLAACNSGSVGNELVAAGLPAVLAMSTRVFSEPLASVITSMLDRLPSWAETGIYADVLGIAARSALAERGFSEQLSIGPTLWFAHDFGGWIQRAEPAPTKSPRRRRQRPVPQSAEVSPSGWAQLARDSRIWRIGVGALGLTSTRLGSETDEVVTTGSSESGTLAVTSDGRAAACIIDGRCHVAWINRCDGSLEEWPDSFELAARPAEVSLLAITMFGERAVRCVISTPRETKMVTLKRTGANSELQLEIAASCAAIFVGGKPRTVDSEGRIRDGALAGLLSKVARVAVIDAATSGGETLIVAAGQSSGGGPAVASALSSGIRDPVEVRDPAVEHLVITRQLAELEPPGSVLCSVGAALTAYRIRDHF